tara:strand:- start:28 stop:348 length:321 start_codon:yes stop_codon:yes gene_type:complete
MITRTTTIEVSRDDCAKAIAETVAGDWNGATQEYVDECGGIDKMLSLVNIPRLFEQYLDTAEEYNEEVTTIDYLSHLIVHDLDLEGIAEPGDFDKHQAEYLVRRIT